MLTNQIVLGTNNRKKGAELEELLRPHGLSIRTLAQIPDAIDVEETGDSFLANAHLKAIEQARHLNAWVIAEDSGLVVDALDGAPGIYSARFSGEGATDAKNNALLLEKLKDVPLEKRTAHYVCHISFANPEGEVLIDCEDVCHGRILFHERGSGGFGYDPLFEIREYHKTFGELGAIVKGVLSHRARALRSFIPRLKRVLQNPVSQSVE